jgi:hypothetical protein
MATLRREPRIDFQMAQAARLDGLDDEVILRLAASQFRILVSHHKANNAWSARVIYRGGWREPGSASRHSPERANPRCG